jgi:pimeloyl-ACP methyl ester carboxylesterase
MTLPDQPVDHWIETSQGRLFARSWTGAQEKPPFVLLHDSLGCVALWRDFPRVLAQATGRRVIAYDRLGFGQSDAHPGYLANDFVTAEATGGFAAVRTGLGVDDFIALGHSVGGGMAVAIAGTFPDACQALITMSAQAFVEDRTVQGIREAARGFAEPGQIDRLARYHGDKAQWVLDAWVETWLSPAFADWSLDDILPGVRCPVLAIHGDADEFGSPRHPERIATLSSGPGTAHILPGCGHVPHREREAEVTGLISAFLDQPDRD